MHDILFYIFAAITLLSVMMTAFSASAVSSLKYYAYYSAAICGLLILNSSQLLSILLMLVLLILVSLSYFYRSHLLKLETAEIPKNKNIIFPLLTLSLLTALMTSVLGNTRWIEAVIDPERNSLSTIFTKYLPVISVITIAVSAMIPAVTKIILLAEDKD